MKKNIYLPMLLSLTTLQAALLFSPTWAAENQSNLVTFTVHNESNYTVNFVKYFFASWPNYEEVIKDLDNLPKTLAPHEQVDFHIDMSKSRYLGELPNHSNLVIRYEYAPHSLADHSDYSICEFGIDFTEQGYKLTTAGHLGKDYTSCEEDLDSNNFYIK